MSNDIGRLGALPGIITLLAASGIGVAINNDDSEERQREKHRRFADAYSGKGSLQVTRDPEPRDPDMPRRLRDAMGFKHDARPERPRRVVNYIHDEPTLTKRQKRRAKGKR